jgi:hypothetical protein
MIAFTDDKRTEKIVQQRGVYVYTTKVVPVRLISCTHKKKEKKKIVANAQGRINGETSRVDSYKIYIYQASIETKKSYLYIC